MAQRLELQALLEALLGSRNVYFQPPTNVNMKYPCIVYNRDYIDIEHANNTSYKTMRRYLITVIDRDPDSEFPGKVAALPRTSFQRAFPSEGLNHDVFHIYF